MSVASFLQFGDVFNHIIMTTAAVCTRLIST